MPNAWCEWVQWVPPPSECPEVANPRAKGLVGRRGEQVPDLRLVVAAVAAQRTDGGQLAGLGPACDRLGVNAEHGGDFGRGEQLADGLNLGPGHVNSRCSAPMWRMTFA